MPNGASGPLRLTLYALLAIAAAQQQQPHGKNARHRSSPHENAALRPVTPIQNHPLNEASILNLAPNHKHKKDTTPKYLPNERAVATIAPADDYNPAVRAPPAKPAAGPSGALSPRRARSLQDWEVENIVLLATVDGSIYATDRNTGQELWKFYSEKPVVETTYHRGNIEAGDLGTAEKDDFMWIVEPNQDGSLYVLTPGPDVQIHKLGLTVKQLEELSPYASEDSPFVYTAEKKNTLITLNATNGVALKYFSAGGSGVIDSASCRKVSGLEIDEDDECEPTPTIHLGRTDYTVGIQDRDTGESICTIRYFEWTPNNRDKDLQAQYLATLDDKYIYSRFDGGVIALDHKQDSGRFLYKKKFTHSPIVRVFDVARPQGADVRDIPLVILPQPVAPVMKGKHAESIFLNCTDSGSWYALSEMSYPSVTDGAVEAKCYQPIPWMDAIAGQTEARVISPAELIGVHSLSDLREGERDVPRLGPPPAVIAMPAPPVTNNPNNDATPAQIEMPAAKASMLLESGISWSWVVTILLLTFIATQQNRNSGLPLNKWVRDLLGTSSKMTETMDKSLITVSPTTAENAAEEPVKEIIVGAEEVPATQEIETERKVRFAIEDEAEDAKDPLSESQELTPSISASDTQDPTPGETEAGELDQDPPSPETPKKKKTHRGQRGGRKRNGKKNKDKEKEEADDEVTRIIEGVVKHEQGMQPDEHAVIEDNVQDISGSVQLNNLVVHNDKVLGYGSGGTVVYEGNFEGREVAVKRMLLQYFDLASQEVTLLQQSDDHPNVIRYFCHQKGRDFLYIAVERCQASLWDLFKDGGFAEGLTSDRLEVVHGINSNVSAALYQLAAGLSHLHNLRIIHRDIKPQNILIAFPKKNQKTGPRFVISDFGLCRTLPDNVSTLAGTMQGAGTIGWKAPELIGIGHSRDTGGATSNSITTDPASSTNGTGISTSQTGSVSEDPTASSSSGVKRAVDIFSLGCVFYYVLTNGFHPYDSDTPELGHIEREINIKRNNQNFGKLQDLGGDAEEPMHLISWMLSPRPEERPTAAEVQTHPFFWSKAKRLNFLCDVSDHFEREVRDPPSAHLQVLETTGHSVHQGDFLKRLDRKFIDTLGKQRKYTGDRMLDLLRALRNKKNHYADMPEDVKVRVGELPGGYLDYWTARFPGLLMACWISVRRCGVEEDARFRGYGGGEVLS